LRRYNMVVRLFRLDSVQSRNPQILRVPLDKERATGVAFAGSGDANSLIALGENPLGETTLTRFAISYTNPSEAGGSLRASTRPTLNRSTESARLCEHSP
jgi:hypothetical protein